VQAVAREQRSDWNLQGQLGFAAVLEFNGGDRIEAHAVERFARRYPFGRRLEYRGEQRAQLNGHRIERLLRGLGWRRPALAAAGRHFFERSRQKRLATGQSPDLAAGCLGNTAGSQQHDGVGAYLEALGEDTLNRLDNRRADRHLIGDHVFVADRHPLGRRRRPGGVLDEGMIVALDRGPSPLSGKRPIQIVGGGDAQLGAALEGFQETRHVGLEGAGSQGQARLAIAQHAAQAIGPLIGPRRVERNRDRRTCASK